LILKEIAMPGKDKIVDEHFWITATTLGVNGFIISSNCNCFAPPLLRAVSIVISLYAGFLIIHRSAAHADKISIPKELASIPEKDKSFLHKGLETIVHVMLIPRHLLFVVFEFSGAFFYLLLVIISCAGVLFSR
jgi:hypothetical protein